MIELTQQQVQALATPEATPTPVLNPQTQEMFVLVPLAEYRRLVGDGGYDDSPWTDDEMDHLRDESCLLLDNFGKTA